MNNKLIEVSDDDAKYYVNPNHIKYVSCKNDSEKSYIYIGDGILVVNNNFNEIKRALNDKG